MIWKQIGRAIANNVDEIAGGIKANRAISKAVKAGGEEAAENASRAAKEVGEQVAGKVGQRKAVTKMEREAKNTYKQTLNEARKTTSEAAQDAVKVKNGYRKNTAFKAEDGTSYRMRKVDGKNIYETKTNGGDWIQLQDQGSVKASQVYGKARGEYIARNDDLLAKAEELAKTGPGQHAGVDLEDGFNLLETMSAHPVATAVAAGGGALVLSNLLDND